MQNNPFILIVGGADTGRAPMTVVLLRRIATQAGLDWQIESAGVTGHDGDPADPEARDAMHMFDLDISEHRARSVSDEQIEAASLLLAVDSGTARVLKLRYPAAEARVTSLSELAASPRDIPQLYRMQVGAWVNYAREIEQMLNTGWETLCQHMGASAPAPEPAASAPAPEPAASAPTPEPGASTPTPEPGASTPAAPPPTGRSAAVDRCERLLGVVADMPDVIRWDAAQEQLRADIVAASASSLGPGDLAPAYRSLLYALLDMCPTTPSPPRCHALREAVARLHLPIDQQALAAISTLIGDWPSG